MTIVYFYLASGKLYHSLPVKKEADQYHIVNGRKNDDQIMTYCKKFAEQFNHYIFGTDIICKAQILRGRNLTDCRSKRTINIIKDIF